MGSSSLKQVARRLVCFAIRSTLIPYAVRETMQRSKVTILMFHEVTPGAFIRHIRTLKTRYNLVSLENYVAAIEGRGAGSLPRKALIITIDDGARSSYRLLPVIKEHAVPVTIFICSGIAGTRRHFWFMCGLGSKEIERLKRLDNRDRLRALEGYGFEETREHSDRQALSGDELHEMKGFVDFQAHTVFHPVLPMCDDERALFEIMKCKLDLEETYGLSVRSLSYPNGDYGERERRLAQDCGYLCAVTTDYGFNTTKGDPFRLKRIYVSGEASADELIVKASGFWVPVHRIKRYVRKGSVSNLRKIRAIVERFFFCEERKKWEKRGKGKDSMEMSF